jgi:serine phosphatase RsbU (regulator of sigma subunit)/anti-sigma regulatory factor (Ser/Thr protein kinase)
MPESRVHPTRGTSLRLAVACELGEVRPALSVVHAFLLEQGVGERDAAQSQLALAEACNNAIQYAASAARAQPIRVAVICEETHLELRVEDHTPGFDWRESVDLPPPDAEGGRGLFLIRSLMEEVDYLRGASGNWLIMRRRREPGTIPSPRPSPEVEQLAGQLEEERYLVTAMAEELSSCYESLSAIFRYGTESERSANFSEFPRRLLDDLLRITGAEWYVMRLLPEKEARLVVFAASQPDLFLEPLATAESAEATASLEVSAAARRQDAWFDPPTTLSPQDPLALARPGSIGLVHPVFFGETLVGVLTVGGSPGKTSLTAARVSVIHMFADFLAIQLVNARYQQERLDGLLVARELDIARHIQRSLLIKTLPQLPGVSLAGYCESARQVGGDFYDVIKLSDTSALLLIADVMGKGVPAAMFAAILRSLVRALREQARRPARLLTQINQLLFDELSEVEMFITAQLVFVDLASRRLVLASAGHCPLLTTTAGGTVIRAVSPEGMPLGVLLDADYREEMIPLERDTRVLLYTDGVTDAENAQGEVIGQELLMEWLQQGSLESRSAEQMREDLATELRQCQGSQALKDDQTFLILAG